jgi:hypothetical protein
MFTPCREARVKPNNISGVFQTAPGVYYQIDGHDEPPSLVNSTDN